MPSTYTIKSIKKTKTWESQYGEMQSYAMVLEGVGEPVQLNKKMPIKVEPKAGDTLYGTLQEQEHDGRTYYKFKVENQQQPGFKGQPRDDKAIHAQFAIRLATEVWIAQGCPSEAYDNIEEEAKHFFKMISRVKES